MRSRLFIALLAVVAVASVGATVSSTHAATATLAPTTVPLTNAGSTSFTGGAASTDPAIDTTEIDQATQGDTDSGDGVDFGAGVNRILPGAVTGHGRSINPNKRAKSNPTLGTHFQGLNFHDQRFANGGNQFSVEPPDQALCAGNGYLFEAVNDVAQVFDTSGTPLLNGGAAVDLNTFFGYAPAIVRSGPNAGQRGPSVTDPVCLYDKATNRFFFVVLTLDHVGTGGQILFVAQADGFTGPRLDEYDMTARAQFADAGRGQANTVFVILDFLRYANFHESSPFV